jgi:hypothetical protein
VTLYFCLIVSIIAEALLGVSTVHAVETSQYKTIIERAIKKDVTVFSNSYLAEQFFSWHKNNPFSSFDIDTVFFKEDYQEVWIHPKSSKSPENYTIAMLMDNEADLKIVEVRTLR